MASRGADLSTRRERTPPACTRRRTRCRHRIRPDLEYDREAHPPGSYHRRGKPLRSASYEQRPDIAVEIERAGSQLQVLIFDPKYKLDSEELEGEITDGRPKKVDIDKMHAYRDAIRTVTDERAVLFAAVIYPGASDEPFGEGLEAIAARPGTTIRSRLEPLLARHLTQPTVSEVAAA